MASSTGTPATDWRLLSLPAREREYSPSSCIGGNYLPFIEAYQRRSQSAMVQCEALGATWSTHHYGHQEANRMNLCLPVTPGDSLGKKPALLVFIHGGYWQELSAQDSLFPALGCIQHGVAYAALDYPLAPGASLPDIVAQCRLAITWLFANAGTLGFDPHRVVVAGSSAGAHLAAMVAWPGWQPTDQGHAFAVRAAVLVSGIYALEPLMGTTINTALQMDAQTAQEQSPALLPLAGFPQTLVCWGAIETEEFKRQSRHFSRALTDTGTACEIFEVTQRNHFDVILDLTNVDTPLGRKTLALLGCD
jgi:arylformamidase